MAREGIEEEEVLVRISRGTGELRISLASYLGHRFANLRAFMFSKRAGELIPDPKRGITVRATELRAVADALARAADKVDGK